MMLYSRSGFSFSSGILDSETVLFSNFKAAANGASSQCMWYLWLEPFDKGTKLAIWSSIDICI